MRICFSTASGVILDLLEDFRQALPAVELGLGGFVEVAAELGEGRHVVYWARSRRSVPATCFMALICALPPTRDTERPTSTAGLMPLLNKSV